MTTNKLLKLPKFRKIRFDFRRRKKKFPSTPTHSLVIQADASGIDDSFAGTIESFPHPSEVAVLDNESGQHSALFTSDVQSALPHAIVFGLFAVSAFCTIRGAMCKTSSVLNNQAEILAVLENRSEYTTGDLLSLLRDGIELPVIRFGENKSVDDKACVHSAPLYLRQKFGELMEEHRKLRKYLSTSSLKAIFKANENELDRWEDGRHGQLANCEQMFKHCNELRANLHRYSELLFGIPKLYEELLRIGREERTLREETEKAVAEERSNRNEEAATSLTMTFTSPPTHLSWMDRDLLTLDAPTPPSASKSRTNSE